MDDPETQSQADAHPDWKLDITPGKTDAELSRWRDGDVASSYDDALRLLLRLQGEVGALSETADEDDGLGLATTVGKAERASRAAEVVERM